MCKFNVFTLKIIFLIIFFGLQVNVLEAHPHVPTLATSGLDKTIKIWEPLNESQQPNKKKLRLVN